MTQPEYDRQKQRIKQVRDYMAALIAEENERCLMAMKDIETAQKYIVAAQNRGARASASIALFEIRLQEMDKLEAELNAATIETEAKGKE
jgi:hypothetical protein